MLADNFHRGNYFAIIEPGSDSPPICRAVGSVSWIYNDPDYPVARARTPSGGFGNIMKKTPMRIGMRPPVFILLHDLSMIALAWLGAFWLRFNLEPPPPNVWRSSLEALPWVLGIQGVILAYYGLHRGVWRYASFHDLLKIAQTIAAGTAVATTVLFFHESLNGVPRSIPVLYGLLALALLGAPRFLFRLLYAQRSDTPPEKKRALIVGAGSAAETLIRELLNDRKAEYRPIVLVDDDPRKKGRQIRGIRIAGNCRKIPKLVAKHAIDCILIAIPSATNEQMRRIVRYCEESGVPFLTLPSFRETLPCSQAIRNLRQVSIDDLLGRAPNELDWLSIHAHLQSKSVMVTGGGGSIGSELCRQLAALPVSRLVVLDNCEFNLYKTEAKLKEEFPHLEIVAKLGSVTDEAAVDHLFKIYQPQVVFHAAAYKHVPLLEDQIRETVLNNVIGTHIVAQTALRHGVEEFVLISSDKAVNPCNVMGATKRAAEMLCQSYNTLEVTRFIIVRFGNVLNSAGSVVPLFQEQIQAGGPVTVTHPEVSRYFMTIPEACQLIMQAAAIGEGGEVFVLDMGEPIKISYLAEQMIRLYGKRPGIDIEIRYTGLRPGEKLTEELFHNHEYLIETPYPKLMLARSPVCDPKIIEKFLSQLWKTCQNYDEPQALILLQALVPEYRRHLEQGAPAERHRQSPEPIYHEESK